ncbi:hypothetical protein HGA91_02755 [candidate division WWE3 bacterium]|nr:hypothetical protein [candidate division WWE3 bacterium]
MKIQNDTQSTRIVLASTLVLVSLFLFAAVTFPLQSGLLSGIFPKDNSFAAGTTYYVDSVSGNDANSGTTESTAWKTLTAINSRSFQPGDKILLKRGQTWNQGIKLNSSGASGNLITIGAYGSGGLPTLNATQKVTRTWTVHSGNIWKTDADIYIVRLSGEKAVWEQPETKLDKKGEWSRRHDANNGVTYIYAESDPNTYYGGSGIEIGSFSFLVDLSGQRFIRVENLNLVGAGSRAIYINNTGHDGNNVISGVRVEAPLYSGIEIEDSNYNRVENSTLLNGSRDGIMVTKSSMSASSDHNVMEGNTVYSFSEHGLWVVGYTSEYSANNNEILNNTSYDNGDGSYITYSKYTIVRGNHFYNNRRTEWGGGEGYGVGVQSSSFVQISGNDLHDNRTRGVEVWGGQATTDNPGYGRSDNNKIIGNRSYRNEMGFFFSSNYSSNSLVAYNFIYDNEKEGILWGHPDGQNNQIINNTLVDNAIGIGYYSNPTLTVKNNIFSSNGRAFNVTSGSTVSNNGYFGDDIGYGGTAYSGDSIKTIDANAVLGDPLFVNSSNKDFHINSNSPYINKGVSVSGLSTDIDGQSFTGAPDIGADEYSSQNPVTPTVSPSLTPLPPVSSTPTAGVSVTPTTTPSTGDISIVSKATNSVYEISRIGVGVKPFSDSNVTIANIPSPYNNQVFLRTPVDDRTQTNTNLITLSIARPATVYIAYDSRITPPTWITNGGWVNTDDRIMISEMSKTHTLYSKRYSAGNVVLSGAGLNENYFNYYVIFILDPEPTVTPTLTVRPTATPTLPSSSNVVRYETWNNITTQDNALLTDLTNDSRYPNNPSSTTQLSNFDTPKHQGTNFGSRLRGYLRPQVSGNYTFYLAADDTGELWLGTGAESSTSRKIAETTRWTSPYEWTKYSSQRSPSIALEAGKTYYIEVIHAESIGEDHASVGWVRPGQTEIEVIPSANFVSYAGGYSADINKDGSVNIFDLGILAARYGQTISASSDDISKSCDINDDNIINIYDLGILVGQYEK